MDAVAGQPADPTDSDEDVPEGAPPNGDVPPLSGKCPVCRSAMDADARYCLKCKTYRGWRKIYSLGVTVPSIILGIISVLALVYPRAHELIAGKRSSVQMAVAPKDGKTLSLFVTNTGTRVGFIRQASLEVYQDGSLLKDKDNRLVWDMKQQPLVIEPTKWRVVELQPSDRGDLHEQDRNAKACKYVVELTVVNYDMSIENKKVETTCRKAGQE